MMKPDKRRRHYRWAWKAIRTMYRRQLYPPPMEDLEPLCRHVAGELTRMEGRTVYDEWRFNRYERVSGVHMQPNDPEEYPERLA